MKKQIFILVFSLVITYSGNCQYSQNIDSLTTSEIRQLIMRLDESHEARVYLKKSKTSGIVGGTLLITGASLAIISLNRLNQPNQDHFNWNAFNNLFIGLIITSAGLGVSIASLVRFNKAKKAYLNLNKTNKSLGPNQQRFKYPMLH